MLRDVLVCDKRIQCRFLTEKDLTYQKAHKLSLNLEAAANGASRASCELYKNYKAEIRKNNSPMGHQAIASHCKPLDGPQIKLTCYHCGEAYLASQCTFCSAECHWCHKTEHMTKVWKSRLDAKSHQSDKRANHYLEEFPDLPDTEDPTYRLFTLYSETHDPIVEQLALDSVPIWMRAWYWVITQSDQ